MRSGRIILFLFFSVSLLMAAEPLDSLKKNLKNLKTFQADFVQNKTIASLQYTIRADGEIALERSGRLAWRVRNPIHYLCLITENSLTQWDADSGQTIRLDAKNSPALKFLLESMKNYFSGNFTEMEKDFRITIPDPKKIRLVPQAGTAASNFIQKMEFTPSSGAECIEGVTIYEAGGDITRIEYKNIRINREIPAEKWKSEN